MGTKSGQFPEFFSVLELTQFYDWGQHSNVRICGPVVYFRIHYSIDLQCHAVKFAFFFTCVLPRMKSYFSSDHRKSEICHCSPGSLNHACVQPWEIQQLTVAMPIAQVSMVVRDSQIMALMFTPCFAPYQTTKC